MVIGYKGGDQPAGGQTEQSPQKRLRMQVGNTIEEFGRGGSVTEFGGDTQFGVASAQDATTSRTRTQVLRKKAPRWGSPMGECTLSHSGFFRNSIPKGLEDTLAASQLRSYTANADNAQVVVSDGSTARTLTAQYLVRTELQGLWNTLGLTAPFGRMIVLGGEVCLMYTNHCSAPLIFKLYTIGSKEDTSYSAVDLYTAGATANSTATPTMWGCKLLDQSMVREQKYVIDEVEWCLAPGQTHIHRFKFGVRDIVDYDRTNDVNTNFFRGWTIEFVTECHGVAATTSTGADSSSGDGQYNCVHYRKTYIKALMETDNPATVTGTAIATIGSLTTRVYPTDGGAAADITIAD